MWEYFSITQLFLYFQWKYFLLQGIKRKCWHYQAPSYIVFQLYEVVLPVMCESLLCKFCCLKIPSSFTKSKTNRSSERKAAPQSTCETAFPSDWLLCLVQCWWIAAQSFTAICWECTNFHFFPSVLCNLFPFTSNHILISQIQHSVN